MFTNDGSRFLKSVRLSHENLSTKPTTTWNDNDARTPCRWFKEEGGTLQALQLTERITMVTAGLLKITKVRQSLARLRCASFVQEQRIAALFSRAQ